MHLHFQQVEDPRKFKPWVVRLQGVPIGRFHNANQAYRFALLNPGSTANKECIYSQYFPKHIDTIARAGP
ncbi:MAG TPA: hypothetical protein DCE42_05305 [Myxococcales bacterium]|nr:hypothetical protein [Deltaproteobacteria bacterium]MBK07335.1 hypothetical protein [Deltaproteobacteria bacterium]MBU53247.1 hypothetical protein [Deltaproteobacteria bacterium]HAA54149.1 hypothetical protein [Myxococcales bacterium]